MTAAPPAGRPLHMHILALAVLLLAPVPTRGWVSASEMTRAQYMLVGRYMVRHFERAEVGRCMVTPG